MGPRLFPQPINRTYAKESTGLEDQKSVEATMQMFGAGLSQLGVKRR